MPDHKDLERIIGNHGAQILLGQSSNEAIAKADTVAIEAIEQLLIQAT